MKQKMNILNNLQWRASGKYWLIIFVLLLLDQVSKQWIVAQYQYLQGDVITAFFNIVRVHNTGAAFSFLADASGWQRQFFVVLGVVAALALTVWLLRVANHKKPVFAFAALGLGLLPMSLSLVITGAVGNVIDRVRYGYVVDFLDFHVLGYHWPAFNVADSCIVVGAISLVLHDFLAAKK